MRGWPIVLVTGLLGIAAHPSEAPTKPPTQRCEDEIQEEFDPGLESRTVAAGPVSVPFRVSPVASGTSPAGNFKVQIRLEAGADATLRTKTPDTSLLFDRDTFRDDNVYRLADGTKSTRFVGCEDRSAVFIGAVLTTGPRTVVVRVKAEGTRTRVTLAAYEE